MNSINQNHWDLYVKEFGEASMYTAQPLTNAATEAVSEKALTEYFCTNMLNKVVSSVQYKNMRREPT